MLANRLFFWDWDGSPIPVPVDPTAQPTRGYGSKGDPTYHPLPDEYWEARGKMIQVDKRKPGDVFKLSVEPRIPDAERDRRTSELTSRRALLAANLMTAPSFEHLKARAAQIRDIDNEIATLNPKLDD